MHKYFFDYMRELSRGQIMASYRLSANKHTVDRPGENHYYAGADIGLYSSENRQQLRQMMRKIKKITR